ncbi:MAG: 23S rRNA (adenine(2030)-N(6))-methyltransferase RlmJ [Burkholderiales bacterium]|nr:23S rRNA (adenine(2030)-N(6))-methyltransferase RlmJ [Burkholderiales bacterium]
MLAYRHLFHAGNFADVFKHALLTRLLIALGKKDKPFFYLDTHAGIGRYDLNHEWAQKLAEHRDGIARLWERTDIPGPLEPYMACVRAENAGGRLRWYPGSPRIARAFLRPGDRAELTELNRDDANALGKLFDGDRQVHVHLMDGYQALKAFLPPKERRGLVLIDSSFDRAREFARLTDALATAHRRWASGVYALWYPLMDGTAMHAFERGVVATGIRRILKLELSVLPEGWNESLRGCGLLLVNPPYGLEDEARKMLPWLWRTLSEERTGGTEVRWVVPE